MPFQVVGDDMSWMGTGAFVRMDDNRLFVEDKIISVEKQSPYKYFFYIRQVSGRVDEYACENNLILGYSQCLSAAVSYECDSIVFPLMGEKRSGLSKEKEVKIACQVFREFISNNEIDIYLSVPDRGLKVLSEKLLSPILSYVESQYIDGDTDIGKNIYSDITTPKKAQIGYSAVGRLKGKGLQQTDTIPAVPRSLNQYINKSDGTFSEYLQKLISGKGLTNVEVYKRANLTKQYFSKLMNGKVNPTKEKLLCIAVALCLNLDETIDFLNMGGYALSPYSKTDLVFKYYIIQKDFDIFSIDIALYDLGLPSLMD